MADQYAVPSADVTDGDWVNETGLTDLAPSVDEAVGVVSDADYIKSGLEPTVDTCKLSLTPLATPGTGTVTLKIRGKRATKTEIAFVWSVVGGATSYILQIGTRPSWSNVLSMNVGNVLTYPVNLSTGTYYSRVIPVGAGATTDEQTVVVA